MVQFNNQTDEDGVWGMIEGRSIQSLKFSREEPAGSKNYVPMPVGTSYTGILAERPQKRQVTDFDSGLPKTFKDGTPIEEIILVLKTGYADPTDADDDGQRRLYMGQSLKRALQDEVHRLGIRRFGVGTQVTVTLTGFKPNSRGKGQPSKVFDINLVPTEYVHVDEDVATMLPQQKAAPAQARALPPEPVNPWAPAAANLPGAVTPEHIAQVALLMKSNFDYQTALTAVADAAAPGQPAFLFALNAAVPDQTETPF